MKDFIEKLITSHNPVFATLGLIGLIIFLFFSGAYGYKYINEKYETKKEHAQDLERHEIDESVQRKLLSTEISLQVRDYFLQMESLHHQSKKQSRRILRKSADSDEEKDETAFLTADEEAEQINRMVMENGKRN